MSTKAGLEGARAELTIEVRKLATPILERPRLVTTHGEFHSIRRQLDRLEETGVEIVLEN